MARPREHSMRSAATTLLALLDARPSSTPPAASPSATPASPALPHAAAPPPPPAERHALRVAAPPAGLLAWLRAQPYPQKLFFRARDRQHEAAAVGFAHHASGPLFTATVQRTLANLLHPSHPTMRFYGARRFDDAPANCPDPAWRPYQGYLFVLPAVELYRDATGAHFLAVNLMGPPALARAILAHIAATSHPAVPDTAVIIPHPAHVADLTSYQTWHSAISTILSHISASTYDKIVLARRKRFQFHTHAAPTPLQILAALDEPATPNTRSSYLFCLQLDHHRAFLGCTPERLFRLEGRSIFTEALAGTVRRGTDGNEGELLSELLSQKNLEEHRFVVDYIRTALSDCRVRPETNGPHVRRLPRLMHLATDIRAQFPATAVPPRGESMVYRLLSAMHPTPAVCGLPRERTMSELRALEEFDRGFFAGPLGWFSREDGEFCVAIRSALVHGDCVTAFAGSGIVQASESKSEWDETELKMSAFTDMFEGGLRKLFVPSSKHGKEGDGQSPSLHMPNGMSNGITAVPSEGSDPEDAYERPKSEDTLLAESAPALSDVSSSATFGPSVSQLPSRPATSSSMTALSADAHAFVAPEISTLPDKMPHFFDTTQLQCMPNLNTLWGCCCIEELCRNGVNTFFISPGSRSAPLAIGAAKSRHAKIHVAHDERGAAFLAVGYARASKRAAAVITSSGTAVANLLPAVVEAFMDSLPLIILTADRPPELRDVGANQAIIQPGIFGSYVRWSKDVPCPTDEIPLRNLLSDVDYAVQMSGSVPSFPSNRFGPIGRGPVHLNMMFRENLAPDRQPWDRRCITTVGSKWQNSLLPLTTYSQFLVRPQFAMHQATDHAERWACGEVQGIFERLKERRAGVIILGGGNGCVENSDDGTALCEIAEYLGWPIISDVCGGLRFANCSRLIVHYADQIFSSPLACKNLVPDAVLQFGERITSKRVCKLISEASSLSQNDHFLHVLVSNSTARSDASFTVTQRIFSTISDVLYELQIPPSVDGKKLLFSSDEGDACTDNYEGSALESSGSTMSLLIDISEKVENALKQMMSMAEQDELVEPWCARAISEALPRPGALFIGNSMPIRDFDAFGANTRDGLHIKVEANRGASGIDGIASSAIGFGIGMRMPVTVVLGDMSMIHDLNALHLLRPDDTSIPMPITIVVVNNAGGGIFSMLPVAKHREIFSPLFDTPHGIRFRHVCETFGLQYCSVHSVEDLKKVIGCTAKEHRLIEALVPGDHARNAALHQRLGAVVSQQVSTILTKR